MEAIARDCKRLQAKLRNSVPPALQWPLKKHAPEISMAFSTWITFVIAASIIAVSPGSGAVLSMSHGLSYGVRKASGTILGLQAGLLLVLAIAGAGVGSLLLAVSYTHLTLPTILLV